ncbi:MAG: terminase small subunit [Ignavibacteriaceae bacterium]|nr:terminase small subunit [Ignavibacteriaceae bacterium]
MEYLKDFNGKNAAQRVGYSEKTAEAQASRLLRNVKVKKLIEELSKKPVRRMELKIENIVKELKKIAFANADGEKIKTSDKLKALEMLGKYLGMFDKGKEQMTVNIMINSNLYTKD